MRSLYLAWWFLLGTIGGVLSGREYERRHATKVSVDTLRLVETQLDTVYRVRVATAERWRVAYDTARIVDTIMRADTVYVRRDVADSAIASCALVVTSCEERVANLRQQVVVWYDAKESEEQSKRRWRWVASVLGASLLLTLAK
jgi:hypothetical protein